MLGHAWICLDTERIPSRWLRTSPDSSEGPLSLNLTSRRFLSPLDTGPSRRLPEGLRPAAEVHGPPPTRGGCLRRHAALAHGGGGARGTAPGPRAASRRGASRPDASRKGAVCGPHVAQNALFRYITAREAWGATARQPAGHYGKWPNWANVLEQPPARLAGGLRQGPQASAWGPAPHGKAQSGQRASLMACPASGRRRPKRRRRGAWGGARSRSQAPPTRPPPPGPRGRPPHQAANPRARGPRRPGRGRRGRW